MRPQPLHLTAQIFDLATQLRELEVNIRNQGRTAAERTGPKHGQTAEIHSLDDHTRQGIQRYLRATEGTASEVPFGPPKTRYRSSLRPPPDGGPRRATRPAERDNYQPIPPPRQIRLWQLLYSHLLEPQSKATSARPKSARLPRPATRPNQRKKGQASTPPRRPLHAHPMPRGGVLAKDQRSGYAAVRNPVLRTAPGRTLHGLLHHTAPGRMRFVRRLSTPRRRAELVCTALTSASRGSRSGNPWSSTSDLGASFAYNTASLLQ